jgi:hypothetical protein
MPLKASNKRDLGVVSFAIHFFARVAQRAGGIEALAGFPHALLGFHGRGPRGPVAKRLGTKNEARHQIVNLIYHFPQDGTFPAGVQLLYPFAGDRKASLGTPVGVRLYHGDRCSGRVVWWRSSCAGCSRKRALRRPGPARRVQGWRGDAWDHAMRIVIERFILSCKDDDPRVCVPQPSSAD